MGDSASLINAVLSEGYALVILSGRTGVCCTFTMAD
jgi:hypothetical protein